MADEVTPQTLITRFCHLQARVRGDVFNYQSANDCFCGARQNLVDNGTWMNEQTAVEWIEQVVYEAIERARSTSSTSSTPSS